MKRPILSAFTVCCLLFSLACKREEASTSEVPTGSKPAAVDPSAAVADKSGDLMKSLAQQGSAANATMPDGMPLPMACVLYGNGKGLAALLDAGQDPNAKFEGATMLDTAYGCSNLDAVITLVEHGAKAANAKEPTARSHELYLAILKGDEASASAKLETAEDARTILESGSTVLAEATHWGRDQVVEAALKKGAQVDAVGPGGRALNLAISLQRKSTVRLLLAHGADPNSKSGDLEPPLMSALLAMPEAVPDLLKAGANPNSMAAGISILSYAARLGSEDACRALLAAGANRRYRSPQGRTAADEAKAKGFDHLAQLLK